MADRLVTVFGGSGFLGRYVVARLARRGDRIRVAVRRPNEAHFLKPLGAVGQIQLMQTNVRHRPSVEAALRGADAAVNLVGILFPRGKQTFDAVQLEGARNIAESAKAAGAQTLVHVSAIGADARSKSDYARTKAVAEENVRAAFAKATILRPSIVFGPEDDFFNRFARLAKLSPVLPLIAGDTRFQPVYVGDVADAVVKALDGGKAVAGKTFELGGPRIYTFEDLMRLMLREAMLNRALVRIPMGVAKIKAAFFELLPNPPLTRDQLELLKSDNVVGEDTAGLDALGISPTPVETILPTYMRQYRPKGQFSKSGETDRL